MWSFSLSYNFIVEGFSGGKKNILRSEFTHNDINEERKLNLPNSNQTQYPPLCPFFPVCPYTACWSYIKNACRWNLLRHHKSNWNLIVPAITFNSSIALTFSLTSTRRGTNTMRFYFPLFSHIAPKAIKSGLMSHSPWSPCWKISMFPWKFIQIFHYLHPNLITGVLCSENITLQIESSTCVASLSSRFLTSAFKPQKERKKS